MLPTALLLLALDPAGLAVVSPRAFVAPLAPYLEARRAERPVHLVVLEDLDPATGRDAPERIKRALYERWRNGGIGYALLVGDADACPVRFMVLDRVAEPAFNYAFYPSDLYYADLAEMGGEFDDWNADVEGFHSEYWGEVCGEHGKDGPLDRDRVSYTPELAVGRWPVSTAEELGAVAAKALAWSAAERPRVLGVHAGGWIDARGRFRGLLDALEATGWESTSQEYGGDTQPNPASVRAALLLGATLALHVGHGSNDSWHECLGPADAGALAQAVPAVYLSVGCSTAHFVVEPPYHPYVDVLGAEHAGTNAGEVFVAPPEPPAPLQTGRFDTSGLGERLVLSPTGGAVAYIGCTTGAQPCALTLLDGFAAAVADRRATTVGDAWRLALVHYVEAERLRELVPDASWYPPSVFFQGMKFALLGDPTLPLVRG